MTADAVATILGLMGPPLPFSLPRMGPRVSRIARRHRLTATKNAFRKGGDLMGRPKKRLNWAFAQSLFSVGLSQLRTWKCPQCGHSEEISYCWLAEHGGPVCSRCDRDMELTPEQVRQAIVESTTMGRRPIGKNIHSNEISEVIACAYCDADSPESLAVALQEGWTNLCRDDGQGWNYLGICPTCQADENKSPDDERSKNSRRKESSGRCIGPSRS